MTDTLLETIEYKGMEIEIHVDYDAPNPRTEWDCHIGTMACGEGSWDYSDKGETIHDRDEFLFELATAVKGLTGQYRHINYWSDLVCDIEERSIARRDALGKKIGVEIGCEGVLLTRIILENADPDLLERWKYHDDRAGNPEQAAGEMLQKIIDKHYVILPLYVYEHSGVTMRTYPFGCRWDSGQAGYIYALKSKFLKETGYNYRELFEETREITSVRKGDHVKLRGQGDDWAMVTKRKKNGFIVVKTKCQYVPSKQETMTVPISDVTEVMSNMAVEMLKNEVETFANYLEGSCYGYAVKRDGEKLNDVGSSCWGFLGDVKYCIEEAKSYVDSYVESERRSHYARLKSRIKNNVPMYAREPLSI
jgi:hypothetical protein